MSVHGDVLHVGDWKYHRLDICRIVAYRKEFIFRSLFVKMVLSRFKMQFSATCRLDCRKRMDYFRRSIAG